MSTEFDEDNNERINKSSVHYRTIENIDFMNNKERLHR